MALGIFTRTLAFIYAVAFLSFGVQARGLIGEGGILPVKPFLEAAHRQLGVSAYWKIPCLLWLNQSDGALLALCWTGAALGCSAIFLKPCGIWQRTLFALLYPLYLSLVSCGQVFMGYQWDALLLEAGFLAIFLVAAPARLWLFQWLIFRLMFESGAAKLTSHDPTWRDLTALSFHWETQPLPTPLAWWMEAAPFWLQKTACAATLGIELLTPWLFFGPRRARWIAAVCAASLQLLILLTGNYTFFNLLTIALALAALAQPLKAPANQWISISLIAFTGLLGVQELAALFGFRAGDSLVSLVEPLELVNGYGLFATMTTKRDEISVEGSSDGETWIPYVFRYKPEALDGKGVWVAPHQPRLDWQMWFAALEDPRRTLWFQNFLFRLLQVSPPVLGLLEKDPFAGRPPRYVRALFYEYHMTPAGWRRELRGLYFPQSGLK